MKPFFALKVHALLLSLWIFACTPKSEIPAPAGKPEDNRFTPVVLTPVASLNEPMEFEVLEDETVYIIERHGDVKKLTKDGIIKVVGHIPVFTESEQGLVGFTIDPKFSTNHWIYLYYAHPAISKFLMTRWEIEGDTLKPGSEKILFEVPSDREGTSHTGGGMTWDSQGNLYITIGNNTGNSLYSQTDQRPDRTQYDDQRGAANTNDLRGKILRIHPEPDGTYSIPDGNLFPKGTPDTRAEIYTMGNRNPWRVSVDSKTGFLYWGEIGPDADSDSEKGPMGYDELNQARAPGFFGWPYFIGENQAYPMYDYINNITGPKQDPAKPVNNSFRNTGLKALPPAQPAFIAYPYRPSKKYPLVGSSSRCAIGGPVYHRADFKNPARPFPPYYEDKWFAADLSRFWIMAIGMDDKGNYKSMERFAPDYHPRQPIDIKFGPTGDLYVLEYGGNTANSGIESRLVRIEYNSGNRKPVVQLTSSKPGGATPLSLTLSGEGTVDFDGDPMTFDWRISAEGKADLLLKGPKVEATLGSPGVYTITLTVKDAHGATNANSLQVIAGNEPPEVELTIDGNSSFFFPGTKVSYATAVRDLEDGSLADGRISAEEVALSIDYVSEGFDFAQVNFGHVEASRFAVALSLMKQSDCRTCHNPEAVGVGPSFARIAERYQHDKGAAERLGERIRQGSNGTWNMETAMPAHPTISPPDARTIANYILNFNRRSVLPTRGTYVTQMPGDDNGRGSYIFRAAYRDKGNGTVPSLSAERVIILQSPKLLPVNADVITGAIRDQLDEYTFLTAKHNSFIAYQDIDLSGIRSIAIVPNWHLYNIFKGGKIEVRLDGPEGDLVGTGEMTPDQFNVRYRGAFAPPPGSADEGVKINEKLPKLDMRAFFAPGSHKNEFTLPTVLSIKETTGRHSLYFKFINESIKPEESLFPLAWIELRNK